MVLNVIKENKGERDRQTTLILQVVESHGRT